MKYLMSHCPAVRSVLVVLVTIVGASAISMAQSGRSIPKQTPTAPAPTPSPTTVAKPRPTPLYTVKVISDIQQDAYLAFPKPEYMHSWAIERLKKSPMLNVIDGGLENRRDAINKAKAETDAYVVLLQLEIPVGGVAAAGPAAGVVRISLSVLSPGTGKTKYSKWIALNEEMRKSMPPSILNTCHTGIFGNDYWLLEASIKAADHVMSSFNLTIPPDCPK